jgi:hypothetical protein
MRLAIGSEEGSAVGINATETKRASEANRGYWLKAALNFSQYPTARYVDFCEKLARLGE